MKTAVYYNNSSATAEIADRGVVIAEHFPSPTPHTSGEMSPPPRADPDLHLIKK